MEAADRELLERHVPRPGWGARLMRPVLDRADAEGLPVSLETLREENVAYYRRHGFEVAATLALPGGGPRCWVMKRPPQS